MSRRRGCRNRHALQNSATEIIKPLVPPDAEERVNRSFKQWNQIVGDHIRTETGLMLSDGDDLLPRRQRFEIHGEETVRKEDEAMKKMTPIQHGRYRHYKGKEYTVIGTARHSETLEEHVVYRQEYGDHGLWVRPKTMFSESVKVDGQDVPRFQALGSSSEEVGKRVKNIFDDLPQHLPKELIQILVRAADVRVERIISHGHASPADFWYDQAQHVWVIVLKGAAKLQFEDGMVEMKPGEFINIPAFKKHRVDWTTPDGPTIWLAVHYGGAS